MERVDGGAGMGSAAAAAMLGMEMHLAHQPQPQIHATNAFQQPELHHPGNVVVGGGGFQHHQPMPVRQHPPPSYAAYVPPLPRAVKVHEEEEMGNGAVHQPGAGAACPWSRMKWTDAMVRLLIAVVYSAGDDGEGVSAGGRAAAAAHGKAGASAAHGGHGPQAAAQQKKGKWKSVSRAMMERGFMVSPQQCEDKFNDLNKRYKRVVDLLGRGTACKVVENPALLDARDELTPRAKEEARKLLSSKHLFFREMCTYHNPGAAAAAASHHNADDGAACFHHPRPASSASRQAPARMNSSARTEAEDDNYSESGNDAEEEEEEEDVDESDDLDEKAPGIKQRGEGHVDDSNSFHTYGGQRKRGRGERSATVTAAGEDGGEEDENKPPRRRARAGDEGASSAMQQLQSELAAVSAAAGGDTRQLRVWMRMRAVALERQVVAHEYRSNQLDRQRLKWDRFRAHKEWDMDRAKLRVQRLLIDVQRMQLLLQEKEHDLNLADANNPAAAGEQTPPPAAFNQLGSSPGPGHPTN